MFVCIVYKGLIYSCAAGFAKRKRIIQKKKKTKKLLKTRTLKKKKKRTKNKTAPYTFIAMLTRFVTSS